MEPLKVLTSSIDDTINEVYADGSEFRLVQRSDGDTIYLSSHTGCSLGCGMCHLTTTGQTQMLPLPQLEMYWRAQKLLLKSKSKTVNFSFMARGDALVNPEVNGMLVDSLLCDALDEKKYGKVTLSTIFPKKIVGDRVDEFLFERFGPFQPVFYWSLYSLDDKFRAKWLPEAQDPSIVADGLYRWQQRTCQDIVIHHALIKGENADTFYAKDIVQFLEYHNLRYRVNLVMYNPPDASSEEAHSLIYNEHFRIYDRATEGRAKIQQRVGPDIFASCGLFFSASERRINE